MYSQYIRGIFSPLHTPFQNTSATPHPPNSNNAPDAAAAFGKIKKLLSAENIDTGDILLLLIILFLFLEGDNLELVITLGLMILLGLND